MIAAKYDPSLVESKWYSRWESAGLFAPQGRGEAYTVLMPPPNVTGILHMGHVLNNTLQDVLVRQARMAGRSTCWIAGVDHASIATEAKVVAQLKKKGIQKEHLSRKQFLEAAWEWKSHYGNIILQQLRQLGVSCDWRRTYFTMDEKLSKAVLEAFIALYEKGYIYRGERMIHWDVVAGTALSDEEVIYEESEATLYWIRYPSFEGEGLVVATTRPETLMGDVAVCVHPKDARYVGRVGQSVKVPLTGRQVPIIADDYVDAEYGSGCLKITPAHDPNDYEIGQKHGLEPLNMMNADGTLNEVAGKFAGLSRDVARKEIVSALYKKGLVVKEERIRHRIGRSERTQAIVEPRLSRQWFCKMKEMAKPALEAVMNDQIIFEPLKMKNTYRRWMENVKDWCISRQLWWGHRIPVWYDSAGTPYVGMSEADAKKRAKLNASTPLQQDNDVLDTWFSSWLLPISVLGGAIPPQNTQDFNTRYPTNDLVTAPEIMFFWVARMIMAGYQFANQKPFQRVYYTGIVRDGQRRKMSKSLGNSPDPLVLIEKYGADAIRIGMMLSARAGNDLLFEERLCVQGQSFANKLWNALRLTQHFKTAKQAPSKLETLALRWLKAALQQQIQQIQRRYERCELSDIALGLYKFVREDFCNTYLELIKPTADQVLSQDTYEETLNAFEVILKLLHPFMPFITEEIWQIVRKRSEKEYLMISAYPQAQPYERAILEDMAHILDIVREVRDHQKRGHTTVNTILSIQTTRTKYYKTYAEVILRLARLKGITYESRGSSPAFVLGQESFFLPIQQDAKRRQQLLEELKYTEGFLELVERKLAQKGFIAHAPEAVVAIEKKKQQDARAKIQSLKDSLKQLSH